MDKAIPHPNYTHPWDLRKILIASISQMGSSFPYDLYTLHQREDQLSILLQVAFSFMLYKRDSIPGGIQHMAQTHKIIFLHIAPLPSAAPHL